MMNLKRQLANKDIAQILFKISQCLDILGENRFKVLAYEKAADSIEHLPQSIIDVYQKFGLRGLEDIEAIGQGIGEKIEELLKTGKLRYYERLKKKIPEIELKLLEIPGVGPKTAAKIAKTLKPDQLRRLPKLLKSEQALKFFGQKTIDNILAGMAIKKRLGDRHLLIEAEAVAAGVVEFLKSLPSVIQAEAAGSLRRKRETIGDIDIVVSSRNSQDTIDAFVNAPFVAKIINAGEKHKATILHRDNFQIDLELVLDQEFGNLLQHFTGSKEHNVALRTWAVAHGFSISEHGIKQLKNNKIIKCKTEEQVYQTLGMAYIPPELREGSGEIESALKNKLPKLVTLKDIKGNLHIHTNESDGQTDLATIVKAAADYGYHYIAITDHSRGLGIAKGLDEKRLAKHRDQIKTLDRKYRQKGLRVLAGAELNLLANGEVDIDQRLLATLDFVIASVHSSFRQTKEVTTKRLLKAINNPHIDCIGHPSGRKLLSREAIDADWEEVFKAVARTNTLLEINSLPDRLDLADIYLKRAKELGVKFVINTDAHHPNHFALMQYGINVARRGWLEKSDVINTKSTERFLKWIENRSKIK